MAPVRGETCPMLLSGSWGRAPPSEIGTPSRGYLFGKSGRSSSKSGGSVLGPARVLEGHLSPRSSSKKTRGPPCGACLSSAQARAAPPKNSGSSPWTLPEFGPGSGRSSKKARGPPCGACSSFSLRGLLEFGLGSGRSSEITRGPPCGACLN